MKRITAACLVSSILVLLLGCATRSAPDIKGHWKTVNHYAETTVAIPLYQSYVFYSSPMDGTLKGMLTRWAKDSKMTLSYLHPSDFTLYAPVVEIRTSNLAQAISLLNADYAAQHVSINVDNKQIVVRDAGAVTASEEVEANAAQVPD